MHGKGRHFTKLLNYKIIYKLRDEFGALTDIKYFLSVTALKVARKDVIFSLLRILDTYHLN